MYTIHRMKVMKMPGKNINLGYDLYLPLIQTSTDKTITLPNGKTIPFWTWTPAFNLFPAVLYTKASLENQICGKKKNPYADQLSSAYKEDGFPIEMDDIMKMLEKAFQYPIIVENMIDGVYLKQSYEYWHFTSSIDLMDMLLANKTGKTFMEEIEFDLMEYNYNKHQTELIIGPAYIIQSIFDNIPIYFVNKERVTYNLSGDFTEEDTALYFESEQEALENALKSVNPIVKNNGFIVKEVSGMGLDEGLDFLDRAHS